MNKQRRRRAFDPGQYVNPLLNELDWLDEEAEVEPAVEKKKSRPRLKRRSNTKPFDKKQKAKIKLNEPLAQASALSLRPERSSPPLLLLGKQRLQPLAKPPKSNLARELFGYDSWAAEQADQIVDAFQSFQLGLDGILKGGEKPNVTTARKRDLVIDITPTAEPTAEPTVEPVAEHAETPVETAGKEKEQQLYGLIPFRFGPFDQRIDVTVAFRHPFDSERYALVATTDEPGCHSVISEKTSAHAVIRLIRDINLPYLEGQLNWIAIGDRA